MATTCLPMVVPTTILYYVVVARLQKIPTDPMVEKIPTMVFLTGIMMPTIFIMKRCVNNSYYRSKRFIGKSHNFICFT